jgi:hypothetical protein
MVNGHKMRGEDVESETIVQIGACLEKSVQYLEVCITRTFPRATVMSGVKCMVPGSEVPKECPGQVVVVGEEGGAALKGMGLFYRESWLMGSLIVFSVLLNRMLRYIQLAPHY